MASSESVQLILKIVDKSSKQIKEIDKRLTQFDKTTKRTDKSITGVESSFANLGKTVVGGLAAFVALNKLWDGVVTRGVDVNRTFENLNLSISALATVNSKYISGVDEAASATDRFAQSQIFAKDQIKSLEILNKQTPQTLQQTVQVYKTLLPQVLQYGGSLKDLNEITKLVSLSAAASGVEFNSVLASIDGLASGTFLANSDYGRFLTTMGLTPQILKDSENSIELIKDKMGDFGALAPELQKSYDASLSNLSNSWDKFAATITKNIFNTLKPAFVDLTSFIDGVNDSMRTIENRGIKQLESDIGGMTEKIVELELVAKKGIKFLRDTVFEDAGSWLKTDAMDAASIKEAKGELERMLATYTKLIEAQSKAAADDPGVPAVKFVSQTALKDMSRQIFVAYHDGIEKATKEKQQITIDKIEAEEQAIQDFATGIQGIFASTITDAVTQGLEGDIDPQSLVKGMGRAMLQYGLMLALTTETSILAGMANAFSGGGAILAGAALIGVSQSNLFGGGDRQSTSRIVDALNANTDATRENTARKVLEITDPEAFAAQVATERTTEETRLSALVESLKLKKEELETSRKLSDDASESIEITALWQQAIKDLAAAQLDLAGVQGDIAVTAAYDQVEAQETLAQAIEDTTTSITDAVLSMGDITRTQQSFIDKNLGAIESSTDTVARLQARFAEEAEQAQALRDIVGTDATAEQIAQLAKEEQDVLNLGQQLIDKTKETFASTEQAESIIADVIRTVDQNQNNLLTVQETLLTVNNDILTDIRTAILAQNDILSAEVSVI